jgi:hypothetical protein
MEKMTYRPENDLHVSYQLRQFGQKNGQDQIKTLWINTEQHAIMPEIARIKLTPIAAS